MSLTDEQRAVYLHSSGPALVLAGAGSGKSHTILERTSRLISEGVKPERILLTTFSKRAATDLLQKAASRFPGTPIKPRTVHSLGFEIIKNEAFHIPQVKRGVQPIKNQKALAKAILAEPSENYNPYGMDWKDADLQGVLAVIGTLKRNMITADKALDFLKESDIPCAGQLTRFYKIYQNQLRYMNQIDFDDMLMIPCLLFDKYPTLASKWKVFDHIMVDEAQDSNLIQYSLIKHVTNSERNVMWVGDDFQSIYSFMGSTPDKTIYEFEQNFPGGSVYLMQSNFRSKKTIINTASRLIERMYNPYKKGAVGVREGEALVDVSGFAHPFTEAEHVSDTIAAKADGNNDFQYNELAVLYRTNKQSRFIEDALIRKDIPYVIYGGTSFYSRKEIVDVVSILQVSQAPNKYSDELQRIINIPTKKFGKTTRYIGAKFIEDKLRLVKSAGSFFKACTTTRLTWGQEKAMADLKYMINEIRRIDSVCDKLDWIIKEVYSDYLIKDGEMIGQEGESLLDTLDELKALGADYGDDVDGFIDYVVKIREEDEKKQEDPNYNGVNLLTVHRSKGLEWDTVFLVGVSEGLMPFLYNGAPSLIQTEVSIEEERRICYVGVTRAKDNLHVSYVTSGYKGEPLAKSRFLTEMGLA